MANRAFNSFILVFLALWALGGLAQAPFLGLDQSLEKLERLFTQRNQKPQIERVLGSATINDATIFFLPEIHNDPESLISNVKLVEFLFEKKGKNIVILDESLPHPAKSQWDFFTQKTIEILAADPKFNERETKYSPKAFEQKMSQIIDILHQSNAFQYLQDKDLWMLSGLNLPPTTFFGWDAKPRGSLTERNRKLVESLNHYNDGNTVIVVLSGARHVPDLDYAIGLSLMCPENTALSKGEFFQKVKDKVAELDAQKQLPMAVGATLPIHEYLTDKPYAVLFERAFFENLAELLKEQKKHSKECFSL